MPTVYMNMVGVVDTNAEKMESKNVIRVENKRQFGTHNVVNGIEVGDAF